MWKFIVGLGNKLKPGIAAAMPILLFSIFILLNVATWWAGPLLTLNESHPLESILARSITCLLFSLVCFSVWGIWQWKKLAKMKQEQQIQEKRKHDPILQYEERQEQSLNQVMRSMKDNLNSSNYLYALPWYLVLGLETSGKTSLINRSGQSFVFSTVMKASTKKSENPYGFDWWIGNDSVLIDPDGELLTQGQIENSKDDNIVDTDITRRLWLHFTTWLEKTRSRRPLNGIILSIDVAHLASSSESERKAYANILRARLRELMETLSTRLPVYVCLTKFDLLQGFEPFFRNYTREQRDDVLGFTFSLNSVNDLDQWLTEFNQDYSDFIERINQALPHIVVNYTHSEERSAVYSFTRQIAGLKDTIYRLLDETLSSDQFSTSALVRGVYFTSVFQQGVPSNAFDNAASRRYGLTHAINSAQQAKNSTIYFTPKLFNNIIYPEAGLASDNFRVARNKRRIMITSSIACSISVVLLVSAWHQYYLINIKQSDRVLEKVNEYQQQVTGNIGFVSHKDILSPLNKIREATLEFGFFRNKMEYFSDLGLYQGHVIGPKVEETYLNLLETKFLPLLMSDTILELKKAQTDEEKLAILRVYRMLVDKSGRYSEFVLDYFSKYWQEQFSGQNHIQQQLLDHLDYAMQHTDLTADRRSGDIEADKIMRPYDLIISKVQLELGTMQSDERVYRNLKLSARTIMGAPLSLRSQIGPVFDMVYKERSAKGYDLYIPQMLTKKGFEEYFMPQSESVSKLALIDSWVLGQSKSADFSQEDKRVLRDEIRSLYAADYTSTWRKALNDINVKDFVDINDGVSIVENIIGSLEPIQRLLRIVESNTHLFDTQLDNKLAQDALMRNPKFKVSSTIEEPFAELNSLLKMKGQNPANTTELLSVVETLYDYLKSIQESPNVGMAALNATKDRVKLQSVDPIYTLQRIASGLPSPLDSMMKKLADQSWFVVKQEAIRYLEIRWQEDVYQPYVQNIEGRYPLIKNTKKEVSLEYFEDFFSPGGIFDSFYNDQLKLFLTENISINDKGESNPLIKSEVLEQFKQVKNIQKAFFNKKGILDINFSLKPLLLSSDKRRSIIDIDGQYLPYSHGQRESVDLIWPNILGSAGSSKLTLVPVQQNLSPRSISSKGEWSLFHLLDSGKVISSSSRTADFKFTVDKGEMVYRLTSGSEVNPFTQSLFKSFKLSKNLY